MSSESSHRPASELGRQLLAAARDDLPPEPSTERALELVGSAPTAETPASAGRRRLLWALPAAAVLLGVVLAAAMHQGGEADTAVAEPLPAVSRDSATPATATAVAVARPLPTASATTSASAAAHAEPNAVAQRNPPSKAAAGAKATSNPSKPAAPARPGGKCGCKSDDLMCHMRCSQKK